MDLYRLLGGGAIGDLDPLPNVQLAVLPGTMHSALLTLTDRLLPVMVPFIDGPTPEMT